MWQIDINKSITIKRMKKYALIQQKGGGNMLCFGVFIVWIYGVYNLVKR